MKYKVITVANNQLVITTADDAQGARCLYRTYAGMSVLVIDYLGFVCAANNVDGEKNNEPRWDFLP